MNTTGMRGSLVSRRALGGILVGAGLAAAAALNPSAGTAETAASSVPAIKSAAVINPNSSEPVVTELDTPCYDGKWTGTMSTTIETSEYRAHVQVNHNRVQNAMVGSLSWSIKRPSETWVNARGDVVIPFHGIFMFDQAADGTVLIAQHAHRDGFSPTAWADLQAAASGILQKARAVGLHCPQGRGATVDDGVVRDLVREVHGSKAKMVPPVRVSGMQPK